VTMGKKSWDEYVKVANPIVDELITVYSETKKCITKKRL